jgi:catechol 2,3-dioxygenase-like lactoylglutathione lyase family enzyme
MGTGLQRRRFVALLFTLVSLVTVAPASGARAAEPLVQSVEEIAVTVADADRSLSFYRDVLGFVPDSDEEVAGEAYERLQGVFGARLRVVRLRLGDERLALLDFLAPRGRAIPPDQRSHDGGFQHVAIVVSDMDAAYRWLRGNRVRHVSTGPQTLPAWNSAAAGIRAFYFADPDGHTLEIIWFPSGKGDRRWQRRPAGSAPSVAGRAPAGLFLGIDHTAIGVADTEASLRLYRDRLGLRVAGGSENHGPEQERLNNVFGARLRITTLRAGTGPGIELLQYLSPSDGRPPLPDLRANDLLHWQTTLQVRDAEAALKGARVGAARAVSPGAVSLPPGPLGNHRATRAALVRDADGHALLLRQ